MRIANLHNRAALIYGPNDAETAADIAALSSGRFGPDLHSIYAEWDDFRNWTQTLTAESATTTVDRRHLGPPSPTPRQVFAVGLNYDDHAAESGFESPEHLPPIFTKYVSSFTGPDTDVEIPDDGEVDWEVELVVVIGRRTRNIDATVAWDYIAGITVGQDLSDRRSQLRGPAPQFGLAKSHPGFSPQGPWLVTPDELERPDDLEIGCAVSGRQVQKARTSNLIYPVPALVAELSRILPLYPGDVIFTGTPAGVGLGRRPPEYLRPGDQLDSWIEGIGRLHQTFSKRRTKHDPS